MVIAFDTKALRQLCESETKAINIFGKDIALRLKHRLADLRAATCVKDLEDLGIGNPRLLDHSINQNFAVDFSENISIIFCSNHVELPLNKDKTINRSKVRRIKIIRIGGKNE